MYADKQQGNSKNVPGKPFVKGQSGNPKGRPKKKLCIPDILRKILAEREIPGQRATKLDTILRGVIEKALKGDSWSIQFIAERTEGKPKITMDVNANEREPFTGDDPEEYVNSRLSQNKERL